MQQSKVQSKVLMGRFRVCGNTRYGVYLNGNDPNELGLALMASLTDWSRRKVDDGIPYPLTLEDLNKVRLFYGQKDDDGSYDVTIVAPATVWDKASKALRVIVDSLVCSQGLLA